MLKYILHLIIAGSLGFILYIFARALPRISDTETPHEGMLKTHWLMSYIEKLDEWFLGFLEKFLRRLRVLILKFDNNLMKKLHRFKRETPKENTFVEMPKKENGGETNTPNSTT